jgi:hypothetical protein
MHGLSRTLIHFAPSRLGSIRLPLALNRSRWDIIVLVVIFYGSGHRCMMRFALGIGG